MGEVYTRYGYGEGGEAQHVREEGGTGREGGPVVFVVPGGIEFLGGGGRLVVVVQTERERERERKRQC